MFFTRPCGQPRKSSSPRPLGTAWNDAEGRSRVLAPLGPWIKNTWVIFSLSTKHHQWQQLLKQTDFMPRYLLKHCKPEAVLTSVVCIFWEMNSSLPATSLRHVGKEEKNALQLLGGNIVDSTSECDRALLFFTIEFNQCSVVWFYLR